MQNKTLPSYPDGERAVIACCLFDNSCIPAVVNSLDETDFYVSNNAEIFTAIRELHNRGDAIDFVTLPNCLDRKGKLDEIGGVPTIVDLANASPSVANVGHYTKIVREKALLRRMIKAMRDAERAAFSYEASVDDIQERLQKEAFEIALKSRRVRGLTKLDQILSPMATTMRTAGSRGIPSGSANIDVFTKGFRPGELVVVGGRPSMGKTSLATDFAVAAVKNTVVAFFSLEMAGEELATRLVAKKANVDLHHIRAGSVSTVEWKSIAETMADLAEYPLFIDDSGDLSPVQIKSRVRELTVRTGLEVGLVIVDYLQLMKANGKFNSRNDYVASITRDLKLLAKEFKIPLVCLSQLNRKVEERPFKDHQRRPQMADFRDSGSIEQDADIIIGLYRAEVYCDETKYRNQAEALVLKNRNGRIGIARLLWHPETATFRDLAYEGMNEQNYPEAF
jgi:replicative DNA helicase